MDLGGPPEVEHRKHLRLIVGVVIPLDESTLISPNRPQKLNNGSRPSMTKQQLTRQSSVNRIKGFSIVQGENITISIKIIKNLNKVFIDILPGNGPNFRQQRPFKPSFSIVGRSHKALVQIRQNTDITQMGRASLSPNSEVMNLVTFGNAHHTSLTKLFRDIFLFSKLTKTIGTWCQNN